jgi:hypothetical protein
MYRLKQLTSQAIAPILARYQLQLSLVPDDKDIPYSFWGAPEAGRRHSVLYVRGDTPIHSILHEASHFVCMCESQRKKDAINVGGTAAEENATCYLQIILADCVDNIDRYQLMHDMDRWGYSFRLGSTARWFSADSEDAREWLLEKMIINQQNQPTWKLRA